MRKIIYLVIAFASFSLFSCSSKNEPENNVEVKGNLPGKFSVNDEWQVQFSQGNLQYQASTKTWRFADNQYDYIGYDNAKVSDTYDGWVDLFGWGTGRNPTQSSTEYSDYVVYDEWGNNIISNGGNKRKLWQAIDLSGWIYIFYHRKNADALFGFGTVNGVNGIILLPDDWVLPDGAIFTPSRTKGLVDEDDYMYNSNEDNYTHNSYSLKQWEVMESAGAVFLPAAGCRFGTSMDFVGTGGSYWSMTAGTDYKSYYFSYNVFGLTARAYETRCIARSVRLVHYVDK